MKKTKLCTSFALFLICVLLLVSFPVRARLPNEIKEIVRLNRPQFDWDLEEQRTKLAGFLYPFQPYEDDSLNFLLPDKLYDARLVVYTKQALEDVDFFFSVLKYGYAGYQYFGGDDTFLAAKEKITEELKQRTTPTISALSFADLFFRQLNFINDGHFQIYHKTLNQRQVMYMDFTHAFSKDHAGYYLLSTGTKSYLQSVDGQRPKRFLQASLNEAGEVVYRVSLLLAKGLKDVAVELAFEPGAKEETLLVGLDELESERIQEAIYQHYQLDGIPVVAVRSFPYKGPTALDGYDSQDYRLIEDFFLDVRKYKGAEKLILDLRSHQGGDSYMPVSWIRNFTGKVFINRAFAQTTIATKTARRLTAISFQQQGRGKQLFYPKKSGWEEPSLTPYEKIENDTLIAVLIDPWVYSAGELFIYLLSQLDNVVFIGTNSAGGPHFGAPVTINLPNSKLPIRFGTYFWLPLDLADREGVGFLPDLWVHPDEALDLAVKFLKNIDKEKR